MLMPNPDPTTASDGRVLVEHFYRELAADRAVQARRALAAAPFERAFARSAAAFEGAAAALEHAAGCSPPNGEQARRLAEQVNALLCIAARFEQTADLARDIARRAERL
jgi:hypothetical protein